MIINEINLSLSTHKSSIFMSRDCCKFWSLLLSVSLVLFCSMSQLWTVNSNTWKLASVQREKGEKQFRFVSKTFLGNTRELQSANYRKQAHVSRASRIRCQVSVRVSIYPFLIIFHEYLVMRDATFSWFHDQKK